MGPPQVIKTFYHCARFHCDKAYTVLACHKKEKVLYTVITAQKEIDSGRP